MTKKIFLTLALMLLTVTTMTAQSLLGTWKADALKDISALADIFEVFTIDKLTAKTLDIKALDEEPVSFTRTK